MILFKYCVDVKNCEGFRCFNYIYIYISYNSFLAKKKKKKELPTTEQFFYVSLFY